MKSYRLAYDCTFIPKNLDEGISYKGENITDIAIYMVYKIIDKSTNKEVYFEKENPTEQKIEYAPNKTCYPDKFYKCFVDKEKGFKMIPNEEMMRISKYIVLYEVGNCFKWLGSNNPVGIKYEEFIDILKSNFAEFDNRDNKPAQNTAYYTVEKIVN